MEPFLAIGEMLKEKGHRMICAFPEQFRNIAEDSNLAFASLGTQFIEMLESETGKAALGEGGSGLAKFWATLKLAGRQNAINKELVKKQQSIIESELPDRIVYNGKAVYPIIWELGHPGKTIFVSAVPYVHYVKGHTHLAFNSNWGPFLNKLTYALADFGLAITCKISARWLNYRKRITLRQVKDVLSSRKAIYTISPYLFPRPDYWNETIKVLGYQERETIRENYQPDQKLQHFLERHHKILFITFGSMTNPESEKKTRIIIDVLQRNNIPAILNMAAGGLVEPESNNSDLLYFVSEISYDWIFPKIYAVMHHGGSGTTHKALKYGCPTMIIPHILDQFVWNKRVIELGLGPKGIKIGDLAQGNLEPKLIDLMDNPFYKEKAEEIGHRIKNEDYSEQLYNNIVN